MAANRFATLIHRKTNRITLVLVYVFLEWSLIFFILLNSLFSYFILRFADYFGLKRPCLFCSRLDRFFDASGKSPSHRDLLCHDHALEISPVRSKPLESMGFVDELIDRSCCLEKLASSSLYTPIEPDLGIIGFTQTRNLIGDETQFQFERFRSIEGSQIDIVPKSPGNFEKEEVKNDVCDDNDEEFSSYVSSFDCNKEVTREGEEEEENKVDLAMEADKADKHKREN